MDRSGGAATGRKMGPHQAGGTPEIKHWPKLVARKKTIKATHIQIGKPANVWRLGFLGTGFGSSVWQRQQMSLSSGFQVPQFGQFGIVVAPRVLDYPAW
jgi:hypothetical protein